LALQAQLAHKDIPVALKAVERVTGSTPRTTILKGRSNYACLLKVRQGMVSEQDSLLDAGELSETLKASGAGAESVLGAEVLELREWAELELRSGKVADRDDAPAHAARAWQQVSVPARECLGAQKCQFGEQCFVEKSRQLARESDLVVTNHALLAIDAMHGGTALPEHDIVIIDEAHELTSRVTGAASQELVPSQLERTARRALDFLNDEHGMDLLELVEDFNDVLAAAPLARIDDGDSSLIMFFHRLRDVTRGIVSSLGGEEASPEQRMVQAAVSEIFDVAERIAALSDHDVIWVSENDRMGRWVVVAPLDVAGLLREAILKTKTVTLTSATLKLGGDFLPAARAVGLHKNDELAWTSLDVGTPFAYQQQGICYIATDLPNPSRDGIGPEQLAVIAELIWAAGGRTLGLFSAQRSAELAADYLRRELPNIPVLCQGDAHLPELMRQFTNDPTTCLFGTVSLWQGIDVPGDTCELVIIDKIPFPRPDEPLLQARQEAVAQAGGNGFMQVAASHAGLLLAQGAGRLIRRSTDRGVVAILDPRLKTARYGSFLRASMPDFWTTSDREHAISALQRLQAARGLAQ
ncbi:MAG: ATP-dependent DNA helicase, partial [Propionibacteriaceae bacterium]